MSESKFKHLQQEVCSPDLEPPPLKKFCAPCIPNQSYIEPDWEFLEVGEPYLNEKQCEYQIVVTVNKFGDSFTAKEFRDAQGPERIFSSRDLLLRSFIHPAIVLILEEYGKLVADQIICASFPWLSGKESDIDVISQFDSFEGAFVKLSEQEIDDTRMRCMDFGTKVTRRIDPSEPFDFQRNIIELSSEAEVQNPFALELYAQVKDFHIDPLEDILKVHIGIPSFIVDQIPELPSKQELEDEAVSTREEVVLDVDKLFGQMTRLSTSLKVFGKYQSYFYQTQDGFLKFKETKKDFYATRMSSKVDQFYSDLKQLANKNAVNIRSNTPSAIILNANKVRIEFKTGPNGNPYIIKAIYAWREGCEEKKLRKGIKKFKKIYDKKPTVINYIAKLNDIDLTLQARETIPWLDFLVKFTYPLIGVDYGTLNMQSVGNTLGKCVEENAREFGGELRDYILSEALSFADTLSFQYSSAASCEELYSTENQPEVREFEKAPGPILGAKRKVKQEQEGVDVYVDTQRQLLELEEKLEILEQQLSNRTLKYANLIDTYGKEVEKLKDDLDNLDQVRAVEFEISVVKSQISNIQASIKETKQEKMKVLNAISDEEIEDTKKELKKRQKAERKAAAKQARRNLVNHPYAKRAAKIALEDIKKSDTLLSSLIDWEKYEKDGKLTYKKFERNNDKAFLEDVITRLSICSANELTINAVRCLFSGVTKERAFDKMFRSAMKAMDLDVFGFFIGGLPPDVQSELRQKLEEEFGNIPLPWEEDYNSGVAKDNPYKSYLSSDGASSLSKIKKANKDIKEAKKSLENLQEEYDRLLELSIEPITPENREEVNNAEADLFFNDYPLKIDKKEIEIIRLEEQVSLEMTKVGFVDFKDLSDEEKNKLLEEQRKNQGTFGTALGNIQEQVVDAYIEYIFDVMNLEQIGEAMSQVPGGKVVFNTIDQIFKCSSQGLFNPPLSSFLSSFSLDVCGPDRHIGLSIPSEFKEIQVPQFSKAFFIQKLKNAFVAKVETVITKVITMLLLKLFESIDNALCKSLNVIGQSVIGTVTGGAKAGMDAAFAEAFCPDADDEELNNVQKNMFGNALGKGAAPDSAYDCLFKAVNGTMSKGEIIDLLTSTPSNMDESTVAKFTLLVNSRCPELSDLLGDPEDVKDAFGSMGRYIPPELKEYLRNQNPNDLETPIYDAICLTQDELDSWNSNRKKIYLDNGLDEDTADELINKANDRALKNLGDLSDILQKGPQGLLEEAIDAILKQPDPGCANDPSAIVLQEEELSAEKADLFNNFFKRIERSFLRDLIGERSSLIGNILIDTEGNHLQQHNRRVKIGDRTLLFSNYVDSEEQWDQRKEDAGFFKDKIMDKGDEYGMIPETVGISMLNQLRDMEIKYSTNKDKPQLKMSFESTMDGIFVDTEIKNVLNYKLVHNKKSTQRVFIRKNIETKTVGIKSDDSEVVLSARTNQLPEGTEAGSVNYEVATNEIKMLSELLKKRSKSTSSIKTSKAISLFDNLNTKAISTIRNFLIQTPNQDVPVGFNYGYDEKEAINFEDLLYVDPTADPKNKDTWKYSFKEEDAVLGKSATENPRVHFLDPSIHGGRYRFPKIYIEPATYNGWLGAIKTFVPQVQTCDDGDNGFLGIADISKRVKEVESNVPVDERINAPLECRLEVPYDRQIMPANHALLEGVIISTIRTYATEFIVRTFPIIGSIQFRDSNYDSLITKSVSDYMQREMSDSGLFANISRLAYYLLFLEQATQVVQRQIIDGLMSETEEMRRASRIINRAQNDYEKLKFSDYISGNTPQGIKEQIDKGSRIIAYGNHWETGDVEATIRGLSPYKINLARKVSVIYETQEAAEIFLSALIQKEVQLLSKKINLNLRPLPHVYDVKKYMISKNGMVENSSILSGFSSVEQEVIEGSSKPYYGDILDCPSPSLSSNLSSISSSPEEVFKSGIMHLEKFVRVINKDLTEQVMTTSEFRELITRANYDDESRLSDHFGDAIVDGNNIQGSIGVKFGVRLIMSLVEGSGLNLGLDRHVERLSSSISVGDQEMKITSFPIASYELDLIDDKIKDLKLEDQNLGQDIKCYVDRLVETEDFVLLFDTIIKTRTFCSLFALYSFQNFIEAIGQVEVEDKARKRKINQSWKEKIFNDTKRLLRKQFRSVYNSQDDQESNSSSNRLSNINFLKNLVPDLYLNIGGVGFLQRIRIVDANPFDENGEACVNEFQKLFKR